MNKGAQPTVCIVGAGPYGISIAACLQSLGVNFRIFGNSMHRWLSQMPEGMLLKSEICGSSLFDPTGLHTFARYCTEKGLLVPHYGAPVSRKLFAAYALAFQRTHVPGLENVIVTSIKRLSQGFEVHLSSGESRASDKVIVATGLDYTAQLPEQLARLPDELRSHTADHYDFHGFKNKEVTVVGGGQSALETAAILREAGASPNLLVRQPSLVWNLPPIRSRRSLYQRWRRPRTRYGDGLRLFAYDRMAGLFHYLPAKTRIEMVRSELGPAGAWWLKERVIGQLPIFLNHQIHRVETRGGRAVLQATDGNGGRREFVTDHVIAGTGYRFDLRKLPVLGEDLKTRLLHEQHSPVLSSSFESSVPGLYFTGLSSANSFGPTMRFLAGAEYPARRISLRLARQQGLPIRPFALPEKCPEI